jgi:hypothetical protein
VIKKPQPWSITDTGEPQSHKTTIPAVLGVTKESRSMATVLVFVCVSWGLPHVRNGSHQVGVLCGSRAQLLMQLGGTGADFISSGQSNSQITFALTQCAAYRANGVTFNLQLSA